MGHLRKIFRILAGSVLGLYLLLLMLLNFGPSQEWLTRQVEGALSQKLGTSVHIGSVEVGLFNRVTLRDVHVSDRTGKNLLSAGLMAVKVDVRALLQKEVTLRTVTLLDGDIDLYKTKKDSATNFQFVLDAFASTDKKEKSPLNLCVNSLVVRRCQVDYHEHYRPETPGRLNLSHLSISGLDASVSLKRLTTDSIHLRVRSLALKEQSGLHVKKLGLRMVANRQHCRLEHFQLQLPASEVNLAELDAYYDAGSPDSFWRTIRLSGALDGVKIATDDVACLLPEIRNFHQHMLLSAQYQIQTYQILLENLNLRTLQQHIEMNGQLRLARNERKIVGLNAVLNRLTLSQSAITEVMEGLSRSFPNARWTKFSGWERLGTLSFAGKLDLHKDGKGEVKGKLQSGVGDLEADLSWAGSRWNGKVCLNDICPDRLLDKPEMPSHIGLNASGNVNLENPTHPVLNVKVDGLQLAFREHSYNNIALQTTWKNHILEAMLVSEDPAAKGDLHLKAGFDGRVFSNVEALAQVESLQPSALGWTKRWGNNRFSARMQLVADMQDVWGSVASLEKMNARVQLEDFIMTGNDTCRVPHLQMALTPSERGARVKMESSFGRLEMEGPLDAASVVDMGKRLQAYVKANPEKVSPAPSSDKWEIRARLNDTEFFNKVLNVPLQLDNVAFLEGVVGGPRDEAVLSFHTEGLSYGNFHVKNPALHLRGSQGNYSLLLQGRKAVGKSSMRFELNAQTRQDTLTTGLSWDDGGLSRYSGELNMDTYFNDQEEWVTCFRSTELAINDTVWNMEPGRLVWKKDGLDVRGLGISRQGQSLRIDGVLSKNPHDSIVACLQAMDLNYLLGLLNLKPVSFAGRATGGLRLYNTLDSLRVVTEGLDIPDFHFNGALLGHAAIQGGWSMKDKRIMLDADIREKGQGFTMVKGYVSPADKELDLQVVNQNTNLRFLDRYVNGIFGPVDGRVTGNCRIHGKFSEIDFAGVEKGSVQTEILATGGLYVLSGGEVVMSDGKFDFRNFDVSDNRGGSGKLNGSLGHTHLKNITYDFRVNAEKLLVYDKPRTIDMPFYATAFGTGHIHLNGYPGHFRADIHMQPEARTKFYYIVDNPETFSDGNLLRFVDADSIASLENDSIRSLENRAAESLQPTTVAGTDIRLDFTIQMQPEARLFVVMDEKAGDYIELGGTGTITAKYYNKGDFTMNGNFVVENGNYKMNVQDVIRKDFVFAKGGNINFTGNPFHSDLNLKAVYTVPSVSLSDLNIGTNLSENSVPVNCVLNFGGQAGNPQISFDLELPRASDEINRMVRSLISSEDDMNMQVLYLLGVGRFYTYDFNSTEAAANQSQSAVAMRSFLSNTLSSQLNNIISNAMGTSNWTFGANLSTGTIGWSDMEVEGLLSGRLLNNRLIINGNFGYRDRPQYSNTNFVGDFDISYLLTPGGGISVKAYSETNDRYFTKSSLTTQGAGIQLKRNFSSMKDLFTIRKKRTKAQTSADK